jgi:hypothetical protein
MLLLLGILGDDEIKSIWFSVGTFVQMLVLF